MITTAEAAEFSVEGHGTYLSQDDPAGVTG